jgi:hypothetical protein
MNSFAKIFLAFLVFALSFGLGALALYFSYQKVNAPPTTAEVYNYDFVSGTAEIRLPSNPNYDFLKVEDASNYSGDYCTFDKSNPENAFCQTYKNNNNVVEFSTVRSVCNGKVRVCADNKVFNTTSMSQLAINSGEVECGKTIQLDTFAGACETIINGERKCSNVHPPEDWLVFYTGDCPEQVISSCQDLSANRSQIEYGQTITYTVTKTGGDTTTYAKIKILNDQNQEMLGYSNRENDQYSHFVFGSSDTTVWALTPLESTMPAGRYNIYASVCQADGTCTDFWNNDCKFPLTIGSQTPPPSPMYCTSLSSSKVIPDRQDTLTFTCEGEGDSANYANFKILLNNVLLESKSFITLDSNKKANWIYQIPLDAEDGDYLVQCQICQDNQNCTQWGKVQ